MQQLILGLHVLSAFVLWGVSFHALTITKSMTQASAKLKLKQLKYGILVTSVLGLLTALSYSGISVVVCAKIAVYMIPTLVVIGVIKLKQRNLLLKKQLS